MPAITVDLGNVTVRRSETNTFSLSLTSSCTIDLPPTWTESPNASEIASAVKEGTLWITKAGSCQLDFAVLVNGNPPSEEDIGEATLLKILDLVAECPVWEDIGLQLKDKHIANQDKSVASFHLHHPHLSSAIKTPLQNVPGGEFRGLRCLVNICYGNRSTQVGNSNQVDQVSNSNQGRAGTQRYNLRNLHSEVASSGGEEEGGVSDPPVLDVRIDADETGRLLDAGMRRLIGVGKRGARGIQTTMKPSAPSLIGLAPAVWNLNHLELMTAHVGAAAFIGAGLARLRITGSQSLAEKLDKLACRERLDEIGYTDQNQQEDIKAEITKRLWLLCQTKIVVNPVLKDTSVEKESMDQTTSDEHTMNDFSLGSQSTQATLRS